MELAKGLEKYHKVFLSQGKRGTITYTPDEVTEFGTGNEVFVGLPLPGSTTKVFLYQLVKNDAVAVYQYADEAGKHFFFRQGEGPLQEITKTNNPYAEYLMGLHAQEPNHPLQTYTIEPTASSLCLAGDLSRTGNPNLITRFRFGVWVGGGVGRLSQELISSSESELLVGIFANLPIYRQFSLQTELFYWQEAYVDTKGPQTQIEDVAFNRKSLVLPVMVRYSFLQSRGKFIPYLQAGPNLLFGLKKKGEVQKVRIEEYSVDTNYYLFAEQSGYLYAGFSAGAGTEYKINSRHSFFLDVRYLATLDTEKSSLTYVTLSFNF